MKNEGRKKLEEHDEQASDIQTTNDSMASTAYN